ncbi:MAG: tetratricopeptide repeat protein, partial [Deltaproteobacteria bacterium]|nr:tetratricopeptide repeat protein [Deltaproteobacteria bacterium]
RTMSYINDALKKAQMEKDSLYLRYRELMGKHEDKTSRRKYRWKIPFIAAGCLLLLGIITTAYLTTETGNRNKEPRHAVAHTDTASSGPTAAPAVVQQGSSSTPTEPIEHRKPSGSNRPGPSIKPKQATPSCSAPMASVSPPHAGTEPSEEQRQAQVKPPPASATPDTRQLYEKALAFQRTGNPAMAEQLYLKVLKKDPKYVAAMNNLGVIYMSQHKYRHAQQLFQNAVGIDIDYVDPYYNLACVHTISGDTAQGIHYLKKAIALRKNVINWAINDSDLSMLRNTSEFVELTGTQATASPEVKDIYTVKKGDLIFDIVRRHFGVSDAAVHGILELMRDLNPILAKSDTVYPGQKLLLPSREDIRRLGSAQSETDSQ